MIQLDPIIAVVIVSYNTVGLLRDCLASLHGCSLPLQIVVVDNSSADGSPAMVRAEFPEVELLALDRNLGFAAGTNVGLRAIGYALAGSSATEVQTLPRALRAPYTLILNPDTIVCAGAVEALVAFLDAHPRVGLVGPRLLNPDGTTQAAAFRFPTLLMSVLDLFPPGEVLPGRLYNSWWHGRYPQERGEQPFAIDHPLGACMLLRRAVIEQVGGLDEQYFMYSEEIAWCWHIRQSSWAIWQVPTARVVHVGGAATRQFRWKMLVTLHRSRMRFVDTHYSQAVQRAQRLVVRAGMLRAVVSAWLAYGRGQLHRDELRTRLLAYAEVSRL